MPQRIVLVYQGGIANVFEVEQFTLEAGSKRKRLFQHAFEPCQWYARGMAAAGATVMTAGCPQLGDAADSDWTGDLDSLPFADKLKPVGEVLKQSMPGRTLEQVHALFPPGQVYCVTLTVAAPDQDIAQFNGDVQRVLFVDGNIPCSAEWFKATKTDSKDHNDSVFQLELWYDPNEQEGGDDLEDKLIDGHDFGETIRQQVVSEVNELLGTIAPIFRILSVDGPDFQNDPRDPFDDEELGGEAG